MEQYHYIYKITDTVTGQYYIGMRSCNVEPELDSYMGSGDWIREHAKEFGKKKNIPHAKKIHFKSVPDRFLKEVVEHCGCEKELASREDYYIGNLWRNDKLCMNRCGGGVGGGVGENNPRYDPTIYHMWNHKTQEEFYATQMELRKKYKIAIFDLTIGIQIKGVCFYENKDKPYGYDANKGENNTSYNATIYHMWNHKTQEEFYATTMELYEIGVIMANLKSGRYKQEKGISLYENKDIEFIDRSIKHHMWNHKTQEEFYATGNELTKIGVAISRFKSGKRKIQQGICLYENKDKPFKKSW